MRVICEKGFYKFFPQNIGEINRFQVKYGKNLVQSDDYFTFPVLANLPNFSFAGQIYSGNILATVNFAGKKEQVMAANGFTFYQPTQDLVLKSSIFKKMDYSFTNFLLMSNLPQAYCYDENGIINGFNGFIDVDFMRFKLERFFYENI